MSTKIQQLILIVCFLLLSCATYDSVLYVVGKVTDEEGVVLENVAVNLLGIETVTDERGCFEFDGIYPAQLLKIKISKNGYMAIHEDKPHSGYYI